MYDHRKIEKKFQKFWNKKWLKHNSKIGPTSFGVKTQKFIEDHYNQGSVSLLDLGSGAGRDTAYFLEKGHKLTAFDFSENAIGFIRNSAEEVICICGDYLSYDFLRNKYDIVYSSCSLQYFSIEDFKKIIDKLFISLKKDGIFMMRIKNTTNFDFSSWDMISENYFTNGEDSKYRFTSKLLLKSFEKYGEVKIESVIEKHQLLKGGEKSQKYFDITVIK